MTVFAALFEKIFGERQNCGGEGDSHNCIHLHWMSLPQAATLYTIAFHLDIMRQVVLYLSAHDIR